MLNDFFLNIVQRLLNIVLLLYQCISRPKVFLCLHLRHIAVQHVSQNVFLHLAQVCVFLSLRCLLQAVSLLVPALHIVCCHLAVVNLS